MSVRPVGIPPVFLALSVLAGMLAVPDVLKAQTDKACRCSEEVQAQSPRQRTLVLQAGRWMVDLDGTAAAVRAELPMGQSGRWLFVPGLTFAHGSLRSPTQTDVFVPEALFHYQLARGRVRPYVGGGAGISLINLLDRTFTEVITAGAGVRADLTPQWGARLEVELRSFGFFEVGSVGWSLGVARRF
jgi:hypothetical protein